jgi:uncharacterized protein (TIGR00369 family)
MNAQNESPVILHGLKMLRDRMDENRYLAPMCQTLGFWAVLMEEGFVVFEGEPSELHLNAMGSVHGGYAATILDSALGTAVHTTLSRGDRYATSDLTFKLVRPLRAGGGLVRCEAKLVYRGRRLATAEARLWNAQGLLCAHGQASCMIYQSEANAPEVSKLSG